MVNVSNEAHAELTKRAAKNLRTLKAEVDIAIFKGGKIDN